jgi:hypothetical protein
MTVARRFRQRFEMRNPILCGMVFHMKTTINLPDDLFRDAKKVAIERNITLTELFAQAVRHEISESPRISFTLEDGSFKGEPGLQPGVDLSDWAKIRELIYEGRGA